MPRRHTLKCWPGPFEATWDLRKTFEYRKDDRGFEVGDELLLREWDPAVPGRYPMDPKGAYTGRWIIATVFYVLRGRFAVPEGYCVMAIRLVMARGSETEVPTFEQTQTLAGLLHGSEFPGEPSSKAARP